MTAAPPDATSDARLRATEADAPAAEGESPSADSPRSESARISVLKVRRDFVTAANRGQRLGLPGLNLQARLRAPEDAAETPVRVGFTCSKKVGGAVQRNRAKRRLRAAAAQALPGLARPGWDYVLIGRKEATAARPFALLVEDLCQGVARLHARQDKGLPPPPSGRPPRKGAGKDAAKGPRRGKGDRARPDHPQGPSRPPSEGSDG